MADAPETASDWLADHSDAPDDLEGPLFPDAEPGRARVIVREISVNSEADKITMGDGTTVSLGVRLSEARAAIGGHEGIWRHPVTGEEFNVSLEPWRTRDPETTIIQIHLLFSGRIPGMD